MAARSGVRWTGLGAVGVAALQLLQVAALARLLAPADFGRMAVVLVILSVGTTFAELGLSSAIVQRKEIQQSELGTLFALNLLAGLFLFLLSWIAAPWISDLLSVGDIATLIRAAGVAFLIVPWGIQIQALLQKRLEFAKLTILNLASLGIGTVVAVVLARMDFGVWALLGGHLANKSMLTACLVFLGFRHGLGSPLAWNISAVGSYLTFGMFRLAATVANMINSRVDQLVIGTLMGATSLGLYSVGQRIALEPVQKINPTVTRVAFPIFAITQDQPERLRRGYLRMNSLLFAINAPLLIGLAAIAHIAVPLLLGPKWNEAVDLVRILAISALLRSVGNASGTVLMAKGRADWNFYWDTSKLLVVPLTVWLAAEWTNSIHGIAICLVTLQIALLIVHYFFLLRPLIGACGRDYLSSMLRPAVLAAVMGVIVGQCAKMLQALPLFAEAIVLIVTGVVTYYLLSLFFQRAILIEIAGVLGRASRPVNAVNVK